jgi:hypothetical protein
MKVVHTWEHLNGSHCLTWMIAGERLELEMVCRYGTECLVTKYVRVNVLFLVSVIYMCMEQNYACNKTVKNTAKNIQLNV